MKKRKPNIHKIKVLRTKDAFKGERSPYHEWARNSDAIGGGEFNERVEANPDVLPETENATPSIPQLLMGEAIAHMQGRQKEVYLLTMREGKSLAETADILGIEKASAQVYKDRAVKFLMKYCQEAIRNGRA